MGTPVHIADDRGRELEILAPPRRVVSLVPSENVLSPLAPLIKYWSTPKQAARVITEVLTDTSDQTGIYYDENGKPMTGSAQVRDPAFADRVVTETRDLLAHRTVVGSR